MSCDNGRCPCHPSPKSKTVTWLERAFFAFSRLTIALLFLMPFLGMWMLNLVGVTFPLTILVYIVLDTLE